MALNQDPRYEAMDQFTQAEPYFNVAEEIELPGDRPGTAKTLLDDRPGTAKSQDAAKWEQAFNGSVKRLLVDFDLSEDPKYRLNHLDRVHNWFVAHGHKKSRKVQKTPNYLKVEKNEPVPAGSTVHVSGQLSNTSLILAGSMSMRRSRNLPDLPPGAPDIYKKPPPTPRTAR